MINVCGKVKNSKNIGGTFKRESHGLEESGDVQLRSVHIQIYKAINALLSVVSSVVRKEFG